MGRSTLSDTFDVFFSYRVAQAEAARPLLDALDRAGLRVWRDAQRIDTGEGISDAVRAGLSSSRALVAWYSPDYDASAVCRWELRGAWVSAEAVGKPTDRVALVLPAGFTDPRRVLPRRALRAEHDALCFTAPADPSATAAWDALAAQVAARVRKLDGRPFGALRSLELHPRWVPHRKLGSNRFVGRLGELWELHGALQESRHVAVTGVDRARTAQVRGLGGVGKTLLAAEYAVLFERAWPGGVYWIDAAGREPTDIFVDLGGRIGVGSPIGKAEETEAMVRAHFQQIREPYLWVLDDLPVGVDQRGVEARSAPSGAGHTLITTRSRTLGAVGRQVDLDVLSAEEALDLLTRRRPPAGPDEHAAAVELCARLGNHPLAVDVLGALVHETRSPTPFADWLRRLGREDRDALALGEELAEELPTGVSRNVAAVLGTSLRALGEEARDVLRVAALVAAAPIPDALLLATFGAERDADAAGDALRRGVGQLRAHSLGQETDGGIVVHALVSRAARFSEPNPPRAEAIRAALARAIEAALEGVDDIRRHRELEGVVVHARRRVVGGLSIELAGVAGALAHHDHVRGSYALAGEGWARLLEFQRSSLGPEHPATLGTTQNLAVTLKAQGDLAGARALCERALEALTRILGPEHPDTLGTTQNLAITLKAQGDLAGARALEGRALEARTRILGPEHPDTLTATQNLAGTLQAQGDLAGARALFERALEAQTRILGPEHPDTLGTTQNLANTLQAQGDLAGARALEERALEARTRILGPEHPETLNTTQNLAVTLKAQGDLAGARALEERALEARSRILGPEHPHTLGTTQNLAITLKAQGDLVGARALEERALEAQTRILGPEHPDTRVTRFNLVLTLLRLDPTAAIPHVRRLQTIRTQRPETLAATDRQILAALPQLERLLNLPTP